MSLCINLRFSLNVRQLGVGVGVAQSLFPPFLFLLSKAHRGQYNPADVSTLRCASLGLVLLIYDWTDGNSHTSEYDARNRNWMFVFGCHAANRVGSKAALAGSISSLLLTNNLRAVVVML